MYIFILLPGVFQNGFCLGVRMDHRVHQQSLERQLLIPKDYCLASLAFVGGNPFQ